VRDSEVIIVPLKQASDFHAGPPISRMVRLLIRPITIGLMPHI
jgi:hypothetical protein